jgi:hypothetical protein
MLLWHLTFLLGMLLSPDFKNLCQHMFVYNYLFPQHDLDFLMLKIQLLVVQKFNQNVVTRSFTLNLKHTYQSSSICPRSLFLPKACLKQNILQIAIITLFCRSKNVLNLIILVNLHLLPVQIVAIACQFLFLVHFLLGM